MREYGIPKLLTWRWTPFAALVLGSVSFAAFAMLVIPDRIGHGDGDGESTAAKLSLGNAFVRTPPGSVPASNWSSSDEQAAVTSPSPVARVAPRSPNEFPKRGFSPPLEHADAPSPPPVVPSPPPPPPPDLLPPPAAAPPPAPPPSPPPPAVAPPPGPDRPEPPTAPPAEQAAPPAAVPPTSQ